MTICVHFRQILRFWVVFSTVFTQRGQVENSSLITQLSFIHFSSRIFELYDWCGFRCNSFVSICSTFDNRYQCIILLVIRAQNYSDSLLFVYYLCAIFQLFHSCELMFLPPVHLFMPYCVFLFPKIKLKSYVVVNIQ